MSKIERVDVSRFVIHVRGDRSASAWARRSGPPELVDGMTVGVPTVTENDPHDGEMHPDGDEILVIISGRFSLVGDSAPDSPLELGPADACIVRRGEWHVLNVVEPGQLVYITHGPRTECRFRKADVSEPLLDLSRGPAAVSG